MQRVRIRAMEGIPWREPGIPLTSPRIGPVWRSDVTENGIEEMTMAEVASVSHRDRPLGGLLYAAS
jgi:hypothetical protein